MERSAFRNVCDQHLSIVGIVTSFHDLGFPDQRMREEVWPSHLQETGRRSSLLQDWCVIPCVEQCGDSPAKYTTLATCVVKTTLVWSASVPFPTALLWLIHVYYYTFTLFSPPCGRGGAGVEGLGDRLANSHERQTAGSSGRTSPPPPSPQPSFFPRTRPHSASSSAREARSDDCASRLYLRACVLLSERSKETLMRCAASVRVDSDALIRGYLTLWDKELVDQVTHFNHNAKKRADKRMLQKRAASISKAAQRPRLPHKAAALSPLCSASFFHDASWKDSICNAQAKSSGPFSSTLLP